MLSISAQSTVFIQSTVTNVENIDPTIDPVAFAFIGPYGSTSQAVVSPPTAETVWNTAEWNVTSNSYIAQILIGPDGAITLAPGSYAVWIKITDSPEVPVLYSGPMVVS